MNFSIEFTNPWLLLLLIPALAVAAYTFFKVNKRFRYSSNRIVSIVLCCLTICIATFMVSGMTFEYDKKNKDNEVVVLVDYSYSNESNITQKDEFVKETINKNPKNVKLGIVKFGYDQVYAVPLSQDMEGAYDKYKDSKSPNATATNISRALEYADSIIEHKESAKIVLLTDGIETDGEALKTISNLALKGIRVDVVEFDNEPVGNEVQLNSIKYPEKAIVVDDAVQIELTVMSSINTDIQIKLSDNGENVESKYVNINRGENKVLIKHTFKTKGLHQLEYLIESTDDSMSINNKLYSYVNIDEVNAVLILERDNDSQELTKILNGNYDVTVRNIKDAPMDVAVLRNYDQVILMNIANSDMPEGFINVLNVYVKEYGGGLLTIGGLRDEDGKQVANTYNREDMKDTLYQDMLPVQAEDYKPPVAVTLVIDISGSMFSTVPGTNVTLMDEAKSSAKAALKALEPKDYMGVVAFGKTGRVIIEPTPVAQREKIYTAIESINAVMEPTFYSTGLEKAGIGLKSVDNVNNKHIILISDGAPSASDGQYLNLTKNLYESGITTSVISYGSRVLALEQIAELGHGGNYVAEKDQKSLTEALNKDLNSPLIREFEYKTFKPSIGQKSAVLNGIKEEEIPTLNGFFGTKLKQDATGVLVGEYGEPIYAQWNYGKGKVGSFMSDLSGNWSKDFISNPNGQKIVNNIVAELFPFAKICKNDIEVSVSNKNYELNTNIYTQLQENERLNYSIKKVGSSEYLKQEDIKDFDRSLTITVDALEPGVYEIQINKLNNKDELVSSNISYQAISYSKEYDMFENGINHNKELLSLAAEGKGEVIVEASQVFEDLVLIIHKEFDPRYLFAVLVIVLLLVDLAVRKFKFKRFKEMIKDRKQDKEIKEVK